MILALPFFFFPPLSLGLAEDRLEDRCEHIRLDAELSAGVELVLEPHVVRGDDGDPRGDGMFSTELSPSEGTCPRSAGPRPSRRLSSWGRPGGHVTGPRWGLSLNTQT